MSSVCSLDPRARETIVRDLRELAKRLRRELSVEAVYLFGSFARGQEHEGSDLDLLSSATSPAAPPIGLGRC